MMNYKITFVFFVSVLIWSCTMEKRHYRPGYFVQWKKKFASEQFVEIDTALNSFTSSTQLVLPPITETENPCDTIKLLNGNILSVRITNYNPNKVTYVSCDKKSVNKIVINAHEIEYLKMEDGTTVEMNSKDKKKGFTPFVYIAFGAAAIALLTIFMQWWIPAVIFVSLAGNFSWFALVQMYNRNNNLGVILMTIVWVGTLFAAIVGIINLLHMFT